MAKFLFDELFVKDVEFDARRHPLVFDAVPGTVP
jgi:hypothetical protein